MGPEISRCFRKKGLALQHGILAKAYRSERERVQGHLRGGPAKKKTSVYPTILLKIDDLKNKGVETPSIYMKPKQLKFRRGGRTILIPGTALIYPKNKYLSPTTDWNDFGIE